MGIRNPEGIKNTDTPLSILLVRRCCFVVMCCNEQHELPDVSLLVKRMVTTSGGNNVTGIVKKERCLCPCLGVLWFRPNVKGDPAIPEEAVHTTRLERAVSKEEVVWS